MTVVRVMSSDPWVDRIAQLLHDHDVDVDVVPFRRCAHPAHRTHHRKAEP